MELVSAQSAAAAAAPGGPDGDDTRAADLDSPDDAAAAAAAEEGLPDLGLDDEGQPLSRRLKHQEGLVTWGAGTAVHPAAARASSVPGPAEGDAVEFME